MQNHSSTTEDEGKYGTDGQPCARKVTQRAGGLSSAHIFPQGSVECWKGGSLITCRKPKTQGKAIGGGLRGPAQFSPASRRRLMRMIAKTKRDRLPVFVTLTYPGEYPKDEREWKRHLKNFGSRLGRRFKSYSSVWKMEPQKRGAPHFHLLVWGVSYYDLLSYVSLAWYQVVGSGDERHLRAGTRVEQVRSWRGVMSYAAKYLGKVPEPEDYPELWKNVGRWWGVMFRANVPWAEMVMLEITYRSAVKLMRYLRRYGRIRSRDYQSLTVICGADFWLERMPLLC